MSSAIWSRALRPTHSLLRSKAVKLRAASFIKLRFPVVSTLGAIRNKVTAVNSIYPQPSVSPNDVFLQGNTATYIEEMYEAWLKDPTSVHLSWQVYFKNIQSGINPRVAYQPPPTIVPLTGSVTSISTEAGSYDVTDHMKVQLLVRAFQVRGHHIAKLDPLGILNPDLDGSVPKELDPKHYGFSEKDLDREFTLGPGILPAFAETGKKKTLREIVDICKKIYSGTIGIEYIHIPDRVQCDWIRNRVEIPKPYDYTIAEKRMILDRLIWSDSFERFIATKYPNEKRFGLEGCESLIPGMKALIDRSVDLGIESIVLGMAHRGRLNVLSNVVRKPNESIFCEFSGSVEPSDEGSGDVKYHLGMNYDRPTPSGKRVHLSLAANPSHLEAVDPVVLGKTRALQHYMNDEKERHRSMALLLHGDAAFAAQGVVYETMGFHDLPNYTTGGTVHIVVNNQIGFTTDPRFARSTPYCSDIAKVVNAPIFHVNGDDAEAVNFVCQLAAEWRQTFKKDVVIDIVCYRKYGHNEVDQPSFTQPRMYQQIAKQTPILDKYVQKLLKDDTFTMEDIQKHKKWVWDTLEESYHKSKDYKPTSREWLSSSWNGFKSPKELAEEITPAYPTGASDELLQHVGEVISSCPKGFNVHPGLARILKTRSKAVNGGQGIDWPTAEGLAFGSLLLEGKHVRLSGQDVERGTFSQRHAVLHDQVNETQYVPLNDLRPGQAPFSVCNSSLSEFGTLGFELGYSLVNPNSLILWEAQFGDFVNNSQCIIDQFIAAGEKKWLQRTGLVVLLPHGYDGQGPEHSSGRLERFLQLCDDHPYVYPSPEKMSRQHQDCNMQVVYATTPANYFHVLRRQIHRDFRKPLIVFTSKSLLRHPMARSSLIEMTGDQVFKRFIPDPHPETLESPEKITRHVLCSGQVYYALLKARDQNKMSHVVISRLEQICPFPYDLLSEHVDKYPNAQLIWAQEEPLNSGSWTYVAPRIRTLMNHSKTHEGKAAKPATRLPSASPATGNKKQHIQEEHELISQALIGQIIKPKEVVSGIPVWA
ncbi:12311_t:CDS:2 [Funneliformis geosporum]|uniref:2-oxoglutarate dehydrogenase, mitochondrial n=1 Tax=Funneliformis geosporum TaxID=1117311 RepID=A0A9W4SJ19_9GLOM|nr:10523_t:CDS:2 [Funneliformis geosporum]CAI2172427.1 12311_t:CDS:2 [Funneliformis geosporum]